MAEVESILISCLFLLFIALLLYSQWKNNRPRQLTDDDSCIENESIKQARLQRFQNTRGETREVEYETSQKGLSRSSQNDDGLRRRLLRGDELRKTRASYFESQAGQHNDGEDGGQEKSSDVSAADHHDPVERSASSNVQKNSAQVTRYLKYGENSTDAMFASGGYETGTQQPVCQPIKTLEDVLSWRPGFDEFNMASVPYSPPATAQENRPKTLVCHDMKGGYTEDRYTQGCETDECYRLYHWQFVDVFVYFSHYFVTIPPPCWTNAGHTNAVSVLGTVITEWEDGSQRCVEFLSSESSYKKLANQLVDISLYYGFDGWLINIENPIQPVQINKLADFVKYLTEQMHAHLPHSLVIWYDSVTYKGDLKWQNELNSQNRLFFDNCDGIFLNYTWTEANLVHSAGAASVTTPRMNDVYVGVDVFGRGCFGGGGYNCNKALSIIRQHKLSVALFAPGWVMEKFGEDNFISNQNKFWNLLAPHCFTHGSTSLPLWTSFCQGFGSSVYKHGKVILNSPWSNMSCQQVQPSFINSYYSLGQRDHVVIEGISHITEHSYHGGGCLVIQGKVKNMNVHSKAVVRLFKVDLSTKGPFVVTLTYDLTPTDSMEVALQLLIDRKPTYIVLGPSQNQDKDLETDMETDLPKEEKTIKQYGIPQSRSIKSSLSSASVGEDHYETYIPLSGIHHTKMQELCGADTAFKSWTSRHYLIAGEHLEGCHIKEIRLVCANKAISEDPSKSQSFQLHVGEIKIVPANHLSLPIPSIYGVRCRDILWDIGTNHHQVNLTLLWESSSQDYIHHYDIHRVQSDEHVFLGRAFVPSFRVAQLSVTKGSCGETFVIQPVTKAGFTHSLKNCPQLQVHWS